jgi:hypothetical protein
MIRNRSAAREPMNRRQAAPTVDATGFSARRLHIPRAPIGMVARGRNATGETRLVPVSFVDGTRGIWIHSWPEKPRSAFATLVRDEGEKGGFKTSRPEISQDRGSGARDGSSNVWTSGGSAERPVRSSDEVPRGAVNPGRNSFILRYSSDRFPALRQAMIRQLRGLENRPSQTVARNH